MPVCIVASSRAEPNSKPLYGAAILLLLLLLLLLEDPTQRTDSSPLPIVISGAMTGDLLRACKGGSSLQEGIKQLQSSDRSAFE